MSNILVLGIFKNSRKYEVVGYIESTRQFCKFLLDEVKRNEERVWDIGARTRVEGFRKLKDYDIEIQGGAVLEEYLTRLEIARFLEGKIRDFIRFTSNVESKFCVIKPSVIKNVSSEGICNIEVIVQGQSKRFKVKDYRWVKYWEYIRSKKNEGLLKEKQIQYRDFLNSRETYFILYKEVFEDKNRNGMFKKYNKSINIASIFWR